MWLDLFQRFVFVLIEQSPERATMNPNYVALLNQRGPGL